MKMRALSSIMLAILLLLPGVYGFLLGDLASLIVATVYAEPSLAEPRAAFLAEKFITIVRLSAVAGIALLNYKAIARAAGRLLSVDPKVALSFLY
jgi:hypothetical protein